MDDTHRSMRPYKKMFVYSHDPSFHVNFFSYVPSILGSFWTTGTFWVVFLQTCKIIPTNFRAVNKCSLVKAFVFGKVTANKLHKMECLQEYHPTLSWGPKGPRYTGNVGKM